MRAAQLIAASTWCLCAGCTVGPNYLQPKAALPSHWISPLAGGEDTGTADLATWWTHFDDAQLSLLMDKAVGSNLTLRIAEERVREARAERDLAAGGAGPSIGASLAYSRNRYGKNGFPPLPPGTPLDFNLYNTGFDAAWELDLFGGTRRAVEAANAEVGATEYGRRDVLVTLLAEVARNYIGARGYQQRLAIARQNIAAQGDIVGLVRSRFDHGLSSDLDLQQATALLTATEALVPSLQTGFDQSVHHLAVLLGEAPGGLDAQMATVQSIPSTPPTVPVGLPSDLLLRRPDIQRAEREVAASSARIGEARAELFPKFSLTGAVGLDSLSTGNWIDYASRYWSAGPSLRWEIFEAGRIRANIRIQSAREQQALNAYQQTLLVALEEVENALVGYAREQTRRDALVRSERASDEALKLSTQLYRSGLADFLNVLESERGLYASQDALVQSDEAVSLDLVQLYKSLGGGWQPASKPTPSSEISPVARTSAHPSLRAQR